MAYISARGGGGRARGSTSAAAAAAADDSHATSTGSLGRSGQYCRAVLVLLVSSSPRAVRLADDTPPARPPATEIKQLPGTSQIHPCSVTASGWAPQPALWIRPEHISPAGNTDAVCTLRRVTFVSLVGSPAYLTGGASQLKPAENNRAATSERRRPAAVHL